ncbi:MAG: hypothetical protein P8186_09015 [Anaerolineae bacterium]
MLYRMWTLILKELIQLARNPFLVFLVTLGPLSEMSLVAWSTSAPIEHLPTAVVDLDRSQESPEGIAIQLNKLFEDESPHSAR